MTAYIDPIWWIQKKMPSAHIYGFNLIAELPSTTFL